VESAPPLPFTGDAGLPEGFVEPTPEVLEAAEQALRDYYDFGFRERFDILYKR
jgi:hypothetical protein